MKVIKRNGRVEDCRFDKVVQRISKLTDGLSPAVDSQVVAQQVFSSMYDGIHTREIDDLSAETCIALFTTDPDYELLAARIVASNIQKTAPNNFNNAMKKLKAAGIVTDEVVKVSALVKDKIVPERDNDFTFFGLKTLQRGYLTKVDDIVLETPQYMFMRVAIGIHGEDVDNVLKTYDDLSLHKYIHATPTLFNAGTNHSQMSSCFLVANKADSIDGIFDTIHDCASISKWAGGIGLHIHDVRARGSKIRGTNGASDGIVPMLRVLNNVARYVNQGGGKRKGSIAIYLEPWHADVFEFLDLRLNTGDEEMRCRDLFTALWIPDEFMRRVQNDGEWTLMCPDECPGLSDVHGDAFDELYRKYESEGRGKKTVRAQELWRAILRSQIETGTPYMLYKDAMQKSNQKHLGVIKSSNLCCEIAEFTTPDETAVCNLASVALPKYVVDGAKFDYEELHRVTKQITRNLDRVIDRNFYPIESARNSNMRHRPIGIGVQGLADVFQLLDLPFDCEESRAMNAAIFETMYHAALEASCELAEELGSYSSFEGSPASEGVLQFDMWEGATRFSGMYDWDAMRERVKKGLRNSLLLAPMPTASTAQILGNCEAFEPYTQNIYLRRVLAGEFTVVNRHLVRDLKARGLWSRDMKNLIIRANGSIQNIVDIKDDHLKQKYRTVWEIPQRSIIEMAADRGRFIDQSQSMNLFVSEPSYGKLSSMHMFAWKSGLKTGMYYLRTKPKANAQKFTLDPDQNECVACSA
jgi:ribonucleoside-diphosphate reductase alpha subunit